MTLTNERRTSTTEGRPLTDRHRRSPAGRRRTRIGIVVTAAALGSAAVVAALAFGGGDGDQTPSVAPIAAPDAPVADEASLAGAIAARATEDPHYLDCMRASFATADGFERRAPTCRSVAARTAACLRELGATADVAERWIDTCRARAAASAG